MVNGQWCQTTRRRTENILCNLKINEFLVVPGIGPIMSCWSAAQRGSGVGLADLNQYFPFPNLLVRATTELSLTSSRLGLWTELRPFYTDGFTLTILLLPLLFLGLLPPSSHSAIFPSLDFNYIILKLYSI